MKIAFHGAARTVIGSKHLLTLTNGKKILLDWGQLPDHVTTDLRKDTSQVGGGALPLQSLPTWVMVLTAQTVPVGVLEKNLRNNTPPVIARIQKDQLLIDLRTVEESAEASLEAAVISSCTDNPSR